MGLNLFLWSEADFKFDFLKAIFFSLKVHIVTNSNACITYIRYQNLAENHMGESPRESLQNND